MWRLPAFYSQGRSRQQSAKEFDRGWGETSGYAAGRMSETGIRAARAADVAAMRQVQSVAFAQNRTVYRPKPTARAVLGGKDPQVVCLVATCGPEVIGNACYWRQGLECHLGAVAVRPEHRGRGVARMLLGAIEQTCRHQGMTTLVLKTIRQAGQVPFYEHLGFLVTAEREPDWCESVTGQPLQEVELRKALT